MLKLFSDCYTDRRLYVGCGITVPHESLARYYRQHLRIQFADIDLHFTVGTVRNNVQKVCATLLSPRGPSLALRAIHLVLRLRRVADLCSSTLSVNCEKAEKDTLE